jgi:hypothetical protein
MKAILSTLATKDIILGVVHLIAAIVFVRIVITAFNGQ